MTNEQRSKEKLKTIISSKSRPCIFPFNYEEETYTSCTDKDSVVTWCATGLDEEGYVVADDWGECLERYKEEISNEDEALTLTDEDINDPMDDDIHILSIFADFEPISETKEITHTIIEEAHKTNVINTATKKKESKESEDIKSSHPIKIKMVEKHIFLKISVWVY